MSCQHDPSPEPSVPLTFCSVIPSALTVDWSEWAGTLGEAHGLALQKPVIHQAGWYQHHLGHGDDPDERQSSSEQKSRSIIPPLSSHRKPFGTASHSSVSQHPGIRHELRGFGALSTSRRQVHQRHATSPAAGRHTRCPAGWTRASRPCPVLPAWIAAAPPCRRRRPPLRPA